MMLPPPIFAAAAISAVLLIGGTGDYVLVMVERGVVVGTCSKSAETCQAARRAAFAGWLHDVPAETPSRCEPAPGCFPEPSNFISGFNMPAELRR